MIGWRFLLFFYYQKFENADWRKNLVEKYELTFSNSDCPANKSKRKHLFSLKRLVCISDVSGTDFCKWGYNLPENGFLEEIAWINRHEKMLIVLLRSANIWPGFIVLTGGFPGGIFFFIFCIRCYIKMVERALDNIYFVLCVRVRASDRRKMLLFWGATLWTHVQTILRHVFISELMDFDPVYYNYLFFSWSLILEPSRYWNCLKSSFTEMFLLLRANSWFKKKKEKNEMYHLFLDHVLTNLCIVVIQKGSYFVNCATLRLCV